jgi:GTPase
LFLLLNKIDKMPKSALLPLLDACAREAQFTEMIPVSALTDDNVSVVLDRLIANLPEGEPLFPTDQFTDQPERFLAGEIVREKAMRATRQEVPQSVAVLVEDFDESPRLIRIGVTIQVEREGQKAILIGRGGLTMKEIATAARKELEEILGIKVFLEVRVKVQPNWRDDPHRVQQLDWRRQLEQLSEE